MRESEEQPNIWPQALDHDASADATQSRLPAGIELPEVQVVTPSWQLDMSRFRKYDDLTGKPKLVRRFYDEQNQQVGAHGMRFRWLLLSIGGTAG